MRNVKELHNSFFHRANYTYPASSFCSTSTKMKLITYISAGAFIMLSAFVMKKENTARQSLYNTKWSLKKIHSPSGVEEVLTKAFIRFDQARSSAGGNGSCNNFGSNFIVVNNAISFTNLFSTKMYCEGVQETENAFFRHLGKANRFVVEKNTLKLYEGNKLLLEFIADI
jgi:heat shock protein HslJ